MGQERHSAILSADARASDRAEQGQTVPRRPADSFDLTFDCAPTTCDQPNILRVARRMRDEWRRHRYSRLTA